MVVIIAITIITIIITTIAITSIVITTIIITFTDIYNIINLAVLTFMHNYTEMIGIFIHTGFLQS